MTQRSKKKKSKKKATATIMNSGAAESRGASPRDRTVGSKSALLTIALILLVGYVLRSVGLTLKPPHFDEGINGHFVAKMWREGYYQYDPTNFHGPLYFYFLQMAELVFGRGIFGFRYVTGLISLGCVALIARQRRFVGSGALWAALYTAIGAGFVFYARYSIHESLFIFCQILFVNGYLTWTEERSRRAVAMMTAGVFGAFTVKETFFIFFITWLIAAGLVSAYERLRNIPPLEREEPEEVETRFWHKKASGNDWLALFVAGFAIAALLFTGFLLNPKGYNDMFSALMIWTRTGTGNSGHEKPFMYWLELLWRYEKPALLALSASLPLFFWLDRRQKIFALTGFGTWLAYSLIPYKTPWLILNIVWPLAFVFGFLVQRLKLTRWFAGHSVRRMVLTAGAIWLMDPATMLRVNFTDYANEKEPYVYVQSTEQMKRVIDIVQSEIARHPEQLNMRVFILVRDPWPLPWIFGDEPNLAYGKPETAELKDADVVLIDGPQAAVTEERLSGKFWKLPFQIRDSYEKGFAYLEFEKFKDLVPSDTPLFEPEARSAR